MLENYSDCTGNGVPIICDRGKQEAQLSQFVLYSQPTPRCWTYQECELSSRVGLFRSRLRALGTHYHPTLDPAVLWTPSNNTSKPICSDSLNRMPPAPVSSDFMALYKYCYHYYYYKTVWIGGQCTPFKIILVTDFGINRKPVCDFLLVNS